MATRNDTARAATTFCLMHSSGQGPEGWKLVVEELQHRGHRALTPAFDLTKTDEGAAFHAETIIQALRASGQRPTDVVCVAHSASGMFLPIIAEQWRPRRMIFLAALIPQMGCSIIEQFNADPSMFNPAWIGKNPKDDSVALEFVFHDCPTSRIEWALSTRVFFYAKKAMEEQCPLSVWPPVPASYIACLDDRTIAPAWQMRAAREWLNVEPFVLPGGHCPNVSRPEALAKLLDEIAVKP
jgi:pimeloyl-ACP methyl ester carboxylesterase